MSLTEYLMGASPERAELLRNQHATLQADNCVVCPCGQLRAVSKAYKCLYCGVYWCFTCAEQHFGQTRQAWLEETRAMKRQQLEKEKVK